MTSKQMKLVESAIGKIAFKVLREAYSDDEDALQELILYAENDRRLYDILMNTYLPALQKFVKRGTYDATKAVKLMEYYYSNYVRPAYKKEFGDVPLSKSDRQKFAQHFLDYLVDEGFLQGVK